MKIAIKELMLLLLLTLVMGALIHGGEFLDRFSTALSEPSIFQHSIFYSLIVYILLWIPRGVLKFLKKGKNSEDFNRQQE